MSDPILDQMLMQLVDQEEKRLRDRHPRLAEYLDLMLQRSKVFGGGWLVLDTIYATEADAIEAQRAAVMMKLHEVEGWKS